MSANPTPQPEEAIPLSLLRHLAERWAICLAFAVLLVMVDPVAAGIAAVWTGEIAWGGGR